MLQVDGPSPSPVPTPGARARTPVAVPRDRGVLGDMRYVFAALFGVARARSELAQIETRLAAERDERDQRLITVAGYTVGEVAGYAHPAVTSAREALAAIEERRSRHAGAVAAADEEIAMLERERAAARDDFEAADERLATELVTIATELAPLDKAATDVRKKISALQVTIAALDKRVRAEEKKLVSSGRKEDPEAIEAHLASIRAEREAVLGDEPTHAARLDELDPKIAALTGNRAELTKRRAAGREREDTEAARTVERIEAAEARRRVEQSAVADADRERDDALLALGERLDVDRPGDLSAKLRAADEHAVAIATLEREQIELQELVGGVDRGAFARGVAYWLVAAGAVAAVAFLLLTRG